MRRYLILLVALFVVGVGGYLFVQGELSFGGSDDGDMIAGNRSVEGSQRTAAGTGSRQGEQEDRQPIEGQGGNPDAVTLRYRVVDAGTGEGIPKARILRFQGGSRVAETDRLGYAFVTGIDLPFLVFSAQGYLLNHYQLRDPETETILANYEKVGHIEVRLHRDRFTIPFAFRFLEPDGRPAQEVTFRIVCVDDPRPGGRSVPDARTGSSHVEPLVRRAWEKHHRLCLTRAGFTATLFHLGVDSDLFDFECGPEVTVRFVANGYYGIIARSAAGGFRDQEFQVVLNQRQPFTLQLKEGRYLKGQLLGLPEEKPVAGARVTVREEGRVVHAAQSDSRGRFRIGPWNERRVSLEFTHSWYRPQTLGPLVASDDDILVRMKPRPVEQITGVVRRRPDLEPIPGARVVVWIEGVEEATATTDELGRFKVPSPTKEPQLHIAAKGFLPYKEIIGADAGANTYDLLPASTIARVRLGLTALLSGVVIGSDGKPAAGEAVHIQPKEPPMLLGITGRRVLEGGALELPQTVFTDRYGRFALEWAHAGDARLIAVKGLVPEDAGQYVNVVLGRHRQDIRLILGR